MENKKWQLWTELKTPTLGEGTRISTVDLSFGVDLGRLRERYQYETMVFSKENMVEHDCIRYHTKEEALLGHHHTVRKWCAQIPETEGSDAV